jgi:hypothetical protein
VELTKQQWNQGEEPWSMANRDKAEQATDPTDKQELPK